MADLRPALEERAREAEERARRALAKRTSDESGSLQRVVDEPAARLRDHDPQLELRMPEPERRQLAAERRAQERRLESLLRERKRAPARIREQYEVGAGRLEPPGIVYLWPTEGRTR